MRPRWVVRALVGSLSVAVTLVPGTALAAQPVEQFHDHFTDSSSDELCGIPVDVVVVVTDNFFVFADGSVKDIASVRSTFTNPENGQSVILQSAGLIRDTAIVDEAAGTITFVTSFLGLPEKIQTDKGPVLLRDAGFATFTDTFDLESGELISSEVVLHGPHPEAESDFELLCDVVTEALT